MLSQGLHNKSAVATPDKPKAPTEKPVKKVKTAKKVKAKKQAPATTPAK